MSDRSAVLLAVTVAVGAVVGRGPAPWVAVMLCAVALVVRQPVGLAVAALLLSGGLAAQASAGLVPVEPGTFSGWVTLLTDPDAGRSGPTTDVRLDDGRHVQAAARGAAAAAFRDARAGERLMVAGRLERPPPDATWLADRHEVGTLTVESIRSRTSGAPWMRAANGVRRALESGAAGLPSRERPLFLGFVLGDTRGQPPDITDDFRGAGLSHLLAVSGQNVAFVLALASPGLRRLRLRARLPATLAVIAFFALMTRFEPSVLRASAMAAIAVTASTLGREASRVRVLALAVAALVLADPFLVRSVGFQLSVSACVGIVWVSPVIARHLPGPLALRDALAVTLGAQVGVAPVLVAVFGGVPVAAVPANLLAAPAEAPVMVWGLGAGLLAGVAGGAAARLVHVPTHLFIGWIAGVAHWAAALPLGELHGTELATLVGGAMVSAAGRRRGLVSMARAGLWVMVIAVVAPAVHLRTSAPSHLELTAGAVLWRADAAVLDLDGRVDAGKLLQSLRRADVSRLDVVVVRTDSVGTRAAADALRRRYSIGREVTPATTTQDTSVTVGRLALDIRPGRGRLLVEVTLMPARSARGPPCRFGSPCTSSWATAATTSRPTPSSSASSTGHPTRSSTRARISGSTSSSARPTSWRPTALTSSTSAV